MTGSIVFVSASELNESFNTTTKKSCSKPNFDVIIDYYIGVDYEFK